MNAIINKFLLAGDRFMSEMRLKQSHFTLVVHSLEIKKE